MDKENKTKTIIIDNADAQAPAYDGTVFDNRQTIYSMFDAPDVPKCSIVVIGYNRLERTKYCVECILKYVEDISYELILVDNGSSDGTFEYFLEIPADNKKIIKINKNIGASYGGYQAYKECKGKYIVVIPNDVYLTKNALKNLFICMESDPMIGAAVPVSMYVSVEQQVKLDFNNLDEMQEQAALYNKHDPAKWEERLRLISLIWIYRREVIDLVGTTDSAYVHDFGEDDYAIRLRRAGYKLILCKDTWIHHDHQSLTKPGEKDIDEYKASILSGRLFYKEKYLGIDGWDDVLNFEYTLLSPLDDAEFYDDVISTLCIDVRCGTPVLEIRNRLRRRGIDNVVNYAFTTKAKYYIDLQLNCKDVACDRIDYIQDYYSDNTFDVVVMGEPVNVYNSPLKLVEKLYGLVKPGGILLFKLRHTDDYNAYLRSIGFDSKVDSQLPKILPQKYMSGFLHELGGKDIVVSAEHEVIRPENKVTIMEMLKKMNPNASEDDLLYFTVNNFIFKVIKN